MQSWRAALLRFDENGQALFERDGLLVTGCDAQGRPIVLAAGSHAQLAQRYADAPCTHWPGRILAPGFIDPHIHYPQTDMIGSPAEGLLPWLERYAFAQEARFADPAHAAQVAAFFCDELARHGVTTALVFCTSHPASVDALFAEAGRRGLRLIAGKTLQDRCGPPGLRDDAAQSLKDSQALLARWHGRGRLGYAITPRFAPGCSEAQLRGAGELAARYPDAWIQSHAAENPDEVALARRLFPAARSYLSIYADCGLMRPRAVFAHCIHIDEDDRRLLRETGAAAAVCPGSNLFLGSGFFDFAAAARAGFLHALASDVGAGFSFSPFVTMRAAWCVGQAAQGGGAGLTPERLWWLHTAGAARALGLGGLTGNLQPGCEADFIALNPAATPLLERRAAQAGSLAELLAAFIMLGDDRAVEKTVIGTMAANTANPDIP
jgi:guanine deaminase